MKYLNYINIYYGITSILQLERFKINEKMHRQRYAIIELFIYKRE